MTYRNKKTGAEIELTSKLQGGDWEPVTKTAKKEPEKTPEKNKKE